MIIVENVLPEIWHVRITNQIKDKIPWNLREWTVDNTDAVLYNYLHNHVGSIGEQINDEGMMSCPIIGKVDNFFEPDLVDMFAVPILMATRQAEIDIEYIHRMKLNLTFRGEGLCIPHVDYDTEGFMSMIYYPFGSDGATVFFDQTYDDIKEGIPLTIREEVVPKPNSAVIFESNYMHCARHSKDNPHRVIVNYVFKKR